MKNLLAMMLLASVSAFGASPTFQSFDTTYFTTNNLKISLNTNNFPGGGGSATNVYKTAPGTGISVGTNTGTLLYTVSVTGNLTNWLLLSTNVFYPSNNPAGFVPSNSIAGIYIPSLAGTGTNTTIKSNLTVNISSKEAFTLHGPTGGPGLAVDFKNGLARLSNSITLDTIWYDDGLQFGNTFGAPSIQLSTSVGEITSSGDIRSTGGNLRGSSFTLDNSGTVGGTLTFSGLTPSALMMLDASKITTSVALGAGLSLSSSTLSVANAVADGSTKGIASFTASDFNSSSGNISLDYANGQKASASLPGFLSSTDWTAFNSRLTNYGVVLTNLTAWADPNKQALIVRGVTGINTNILDIFNVDGSYDITVAGNGQLTVSNQISINGSPIAAEKLRVVGNTSVSGNITNEVLTANTALLADGSTKPALKSLPNGGNTTVLHGTTPPSYGALDLNADVSGNLSVAHLNSGIGALATTYWRGDGAWGTPAGAGDVTQAGQNTFAGSNYFGGPTVFGLLTASRVVLTDTTKALVSATASGAVPIDADGSATTASQITALYPSYVVTNNNANVFVQSNHLRLDVTHYLSLSNLTASSLLTSDVSRQVTNLNAIDARLAIQLVGNNLVPITTEIVTNGFTPNLALGAGLTNISTAGITYNALKTPTNSSFAPDMRLGSTETNIGAAFTLSLPINVDSTLTFGQTTIFIVRTNGSGSSPFALTAPTGVKATGTLQVTNTTIVTVYAYGKEFTNYNFNPIY